MSTQLEGTWPYYREQPDCVILGVQPGATPSPLPPVRIFLGTEEGQYRAERIFVWSVLQVRDPGRVYEIHLMNNLASFDRRGWRTGFTCYRFAIPDLAGGSGKAIYNDVDQIYLADPALLFDLELDGHGYLAIDARDTSVMLIDCEKMLPWWNRAAASAPGAKGPLTSKPASVPGLWGELDPHWNARDLEYHEGRTKCLHYTALHQQPWNPFPGIFSYQQNPLAYIWHDLERSADAAGPRSIRHGTTADSVLGMKVIFANGDSAVLGRGGFGEVWKAEAPGGFLKAIKFVFGDLDSTDDDSRPAEQELKALKAKIEDAIRAEIRKRNTKDAPAPPPRGDDHRKPSRRARSGQGALRPDFKFADVLKATFPAGTVSGAPKIRALEIIQDLEPIKRGIYSGAFGYVGLDGAIDLAMVIRSIVVDGAGSTSWATASIVARPPFWAGQSMTLGFTLTCTASKTSGISCSGTCWRGEAGSSYICFLSTAMNESPRKGGRPVASSYIRMPTA